MADKEATREERRVLKDLNTALDHLKVFGTRKRKSDDEDTRNSGDMFMTLGQAQSFLAVALNEGKSLTDLVKVTETPQSTLSRHLLDLGIQDRNRKPGFGLLEGETDPTELRRKLYTLTPKGRELRAKLIQTLED